MDVSMLWEKIVEYAKAFFAYVMNVGENRFMFIDNNIFSGDATEEQTVYCIISFIIMAVIVIFASDSFKLFHPIEGLREWPEKINFLKVIIFSAAVFSLHTFYKMLVDLISLVGNDSLGGVITNCFGSYINPISICIFSIVLTTVDMEHDHIQAFFVGLCLFSTRGLLTCDTFTKGEISICVAGIVLPLVGAIIYYRFSMAVTYMIMSVSYLVVKFFIVENTEMADIIVGETIPEKIGEYLSCMRIDIGIILVLVAILLIYRFVSETVEKKRLIAQLVSAGILAAIFVFTYPARILFPMEPVVYARQGMEVNTQESPVDITSAQATSTLTSSKGIVFGIENTYDHDTTTCWQEGVEGSGIGETLNYAFNETLLTRIEFYPGNRKSDTDFADNNRPSKVRVTYFDKDQQVEQKDFDVSDDSGASTMITDGEGITCDRIAITILEVYPGAKYDDTCVAEVELFTESKVE